MVKTRSEGKGKGTGSRFNTNSPKNLSPISNGSKSNRSSMASNSDATNISQLRRSTRETPTKRRMAQLGGTTLQKSGASPSSCPSTNKKMLSSNSNRNLNPSSSKIKKALIGSGSSSKSPMKKSTGKGKAQAEPEKAQMDKRNLSSNLDSNSSSNSGDKEEGLSTKRRRVLLHARAYKEHFRPRPKTSPPLEKAQAVEAPADGVATVQVKAQEIVDVPAQEAFVLRDSSSSSKLADEALASNPEVNKAEKVSQNSAEEHVIPVQEASVQSNSDEMESEILPTPQCTADVPPAGSTEKRNVDRGVVVIAGDAGSTEQRNVDPGEVVIAGSTEQRNMDPGEVVIAGDKEDYGPNACFACKKPGILLCCEGKGCNRSYHLSCLDPPLQSTPPGTWLCLSCVQKKIQFGPHAISDGIESICSAKDARIGNGKQYLVKYKNLAHVHNRWVPEAELAREVPKLLSKFNWSMQKEKGPIMWKQEWTEPQQLLMKRPLMSGGVADEFFEGPGDNLPFCNAEWLVKWRDLGYEHATWELETAPFLCTEDATSLVKAFESRRRHAQLLSCPDHISKTLEVKQSSLDRLDKLPDGLPPGLDSEHLHSVNQLRLFWHKSQNAVFIDEQERVIKTILFIMSVIEAVRHPILIVSSASSLPLWESKFQRLAPSVNVVTYTGTKPVRKLIRDVEFYEESGCIMFQVLLSDTDSMAEDSETLDHVMWEAVIVDGYQNLRVSKNLEKLKNLSADFRLVLLSSHLKDNITDYVNMLSYLDSTQDIALTNPSERTGMLAVLKEKLGRHVVHEHKDKASKFVEYWVPAHFSKVQLELYCSVLLSKSLALRSFSKIDYVGALQELLISLRKCCDHPYLVNQELQAALTKERTLAEILDIGVYACGKLLLLDKLLHEMRARGMRVIILFQSGGGSGRNQIGDFLDDFLRQRFGAESYEHVERGLLMPKKQTAMSNFNDKSKGRFVFLIDNRACQMSVKLSGVDAVLIYDSDWNPMNDVRVLQRIKLQPECVPIFRLYSPYAVEEKALSLAKQEVLLGSTLQGVPISVSHCLLSWGADRLFSLLHQLHLQPDDTLESFRSAYVSPEDLVFVDSVVTEILDRVSGKGSGAKAASLLVEVQPSGESYSRDTSSLIGEKEGVSSLQGDPSVFWSALLEGKSPQWRFIQYDGPVQRSRRKVRPFDNSDKPQMAGAAGGSETEEARKKRKKNGDDTSMGVISTKGNTGTTTISPKNPSPAVLTWDDLTGTSAGLPRQEISNQADVWAPVEEVANLRSMQRGIHLLLEPQLQKLCQFAGLPEYVKTMAAMLLEYVVNNFKVVDGGDAAILQTLVISLCWRAASLFKHWLDPSQLTALAFEMLQYNCKADVVESIYSRLKVLKVEFQEKADAMLAGQFQPVRFYNQLFKVPKLEVITLPDSPFEEVVVETAASLPDQSENANETEAVEQINAKEMLPKRQLDPIETVCTIRQEALLKKQQEDVSRMEQFKEREEMRLTQEHQSHLERLSGAGMEEVTKAKEDFERKMCALEAYVRKEREKLQELHVAAREVESSIKDGWVQKSKSGNLGDDFDNVPVTDYGELIVQVLSWDPPTTPMVHEENMTENNDDGVVVALGPSDHIPSPCPQGTVVVAEEAAPIVPEPRGDAAAESTPQDRDAESFSEDSEGSPRNTMMQKETPSPPAESPESAPPPPAESPESAPPPPPPAESPESTPPPPPPPPPTAETPELTPAPPAETPESIPPPPAETPESTRLTAWLAPSVAGVAVANGDAMADTSDGLLPADPLASVSRDATTSHPLPQQNLVQDVLRQSAQINTSNVACNGHGTADENGTVGGVRMEACNNPLWQMPMAAPMFPHGLHADPLRNEITRIKYQKEQLEKRWEAKKLQLKMQMEEEIARIRRRCEEMIQEEERMLQLQLQHLNDICRRIVLNQTLAEEFRAKFIEHRGVPSTSSFRNQVPAGLRPQLPSQPRVLQQIYRAPAPTAAATRQGNGSANGSVYNPTSSNRPPPLMGPHIPSTSPLHPPAASSVLGPHIPSLSPLRSTATSPATGPHIPSISHLRPSATSSVAGPRIPSSSPVRPSATSPSLSRDGFSSVSLPSRPSPAVRTEHRAPAPHLARSRPHISAASVTSASTTAHTSAAATTIEQLQSLLASQLQEGPAALSQTQTQNHPVESLASFGNGSGTGQERPNGDEVVYLSDDD